MGGGPEYVVPRKVGRMLGGENPPNWKRNTIIYMCTVFPIATWLVFRHGAAIERVPAPPPRAIPAQAYQKHALIDDPDYPKKLEELERLNKEKPIWTRFLSDGHK